MELKKLSTYVSTLSLNTSPACSCGTLHYCPWHHCGRSWSTWMAQPFTFCSFHSNLWCYRDGKAECICSAWWYTRLGVIHIQKAVVLGWYFREHKTGEQTAIFLMRVCSAERRSTLILTSNSMLWQTKLLQSVAAEMMRWCVETTLHLYDWYLCVWSCSSIHILKCCYKWKAGNKMPYFISSGNKIRSLFQEIK